jgi:phosphoadenosine phosphosulfate reductase
MQQLNFQGKTKEQEAIEFIREHEPPEGYFLGFSGGKDSTVLYDLALRSGVRFTSYYSCTGLDSPEIMRFIHRNFSAVHWLFPKEKFFKLLPKRGYPTKFNRWCCSELKEKPSREVPLNHRLMGIRAEESLKRASRDRIDKMGKWTIYKPLFHWQTWEIYEYLEEHDLPISELYGEFDRIGCVVCPFICGSKRKLEIHRAKWPKLYNKFEQSMKDLYNFGEIKSVVKMRENITFEQFLDNWYRGK